MTPEVVPCLGHTTGVMRDIAAMTWNVAATIILGAGCNKGYQMSLWLHDWKEHANMQPGLWCQATACLAVNIPSFFNSVAVAQFAIFGHQAGRLHVSRTISTGSVFRTQDATTGASVPKAAWGV